MKFTDTAASVAKRADGEPLSTFRERISRGFRKDALRGQEESSLIKARRGTSLNLRDSSRFHHAKPDGLP